MYASKTNVQIDGKITFSIFLISLDFSDRNVILTSFSFSFNFSMEGGELFQRIQEKQAFNERGRKTSHSSYLSSSFLS